MNKLFKTLEYDKILEKVSAHAVSEQAKSDIMNMSPSFDIDSAKKAQQTTYQAIILRDKYLINPVYSLDPVIPLIEKADVGITLLPSELLKISKVLRSAFNAKKSIMSCGDDVAYIKEYVDFLQPYISLSKHIEETIAGENEIRDSASDLLRTLRRKIAALNNKLKDKLNSYKHSRESEKFLQDSIITVREGRFVLPVKSEYRSNLPGLIHDRSASGSTVYIEPFPIVEMNNELKSLQLAERDEIERILKVLTSEVSVSKLSIADSYMQLTALDVIFAKAAFSAEFKCVQPKFNSRGIVKLSSCRHPLIEQNRVVPIDIAFGESYNILLITGPNTGGKTVSMKTVGLFCLMAYSGLQLPCADNANIAMFDNIYCDIGDEQSIAQSLSTFSSHITNIKTITDSITPQSLVLLDEIGAGTDPVEGAALAVGILKYIELVGCHGVITTHYSELKEYALTSPTLMNGCMQFDEKTLSPTFKLIIGLPGVSNAIDIAKKLGMNDYIVKSARASLKDEKVKFEKVLMHAEQVKSKAMEELKEVDAIKEGLLLKQRKADESLNALNNKLAQINNNAKNETQRIVRRSVERADELIEELKEKLKTADEQALLEAKKLRNKLSEIENEGERDISQINFVPLENDDVKIGAQVVVRSLNLKGDITALPDKKGLIEVASGAIRVKVPLSDLGAVAKLQSKKSGCTLQRRTNSAFQSDTEKQTQIQEIKVLGNTVSEAIEIIEPYLISCGSGALIKIVHGKGTGALGRGLQQYLRSSSLVANIRYGGYGEGGSGVTFVELK